MQASPSYGKIPIGDGAVVGIVACPARGMKYEGNASVCHMDFSTPPLGSQEASSGDAWTPMTAVA
jgi:hypothetical protein